MTEHSSESNPTKAPPTGDGGGSVARKATSEQTQPASAPARAEVHYATRKRRVLIGGLGVLVLAAALWFGIPWIRLMLNTASTDDAFVNGHVTFVAARVRGQVSRVLVDDNNRVHTGDVLVELDKEPYQDAVAVRRAAVDTAKADLRAATALVRGIEAQARSRRWQLQRAIESVQNQISLLHARIAALD